MRHISLVIICLFSFQTLLGMQQEPSLREYIGHLVESNNVDSLEMIARTGWPKENWEWLFVAAAKKGNVEQLSWFFRRNDIYPYFNGASVQEAFLQTVREGHPLAAWLFLSNANSRKGDLNNELKEASNGSSSPYIKELIKYRMGALKLTEKKDVSLYKNALREICGAHFVAAAREGNIGRLNWFLRHQDAYCCIDKLATEEAFFSAIRNNDRSTVVWFLFLSGKNLGTCLGDAQTCADKCAGEAIQRIIMERAQREMQGQGA